MASPFVQQLNFQARDASNESAALQAAFSLGLLEALAAAPDGLSVDQATAALGAQWRGVRSLLEVLAGLRFASFDGSRYRLQPQLAAALGNESYRRSLQEAGSWWMTAAQLPAAVRSGLPVEGRDLLGWVRQCFTPPLDGASPAEDFYDRLARMFLRTQALVTASSLGLLQALVKGQTQLSELARRLEVSPAGLEVLLQVLETQQLVTRSGQEVALSPVASQSLDQASLPYFERALPATMVYWEGLGRLAEAVKTGQFVLDLKQPHNAQRVYGENASRITGIFASHLRLGRSAVALVQQMRSLDQARILDVGTGSGVWGAAFALGAPNAQVTYLDSEHVLATVKENLARAKVLERARLWAADCTRVDLGQGSYDVILLPQILPVLLPQERADFFSRVARALAPNGVVAVSGYVLSDLRDGPMDAVYFSLRRFMTNEGDVLSFPEMRGELAGVGLNQARLYPLPVQELVLATRGDLPWPATQGRQ